MQFETFCTGHKAPVLALAGNPKESYFFSAGADGLIVRWNVGKPDEGDVITRLNGIVPTLVYDVHSNVLYAALNQKGIMLIDCATGKSELVVPIPSTSFDNLELLGKFGVVSTKNGELLLIEIGTYKIIDRIQTGLEETPSFTLSEGKFLYYGDSEFKWIGLGKDGFDHSDSMYFETNVLLTIVGKNILAFEGEVLHVSSLKKPSKSFNEKFNHGEIKQLLGGSESDFVVAILKNGNLVSIKTGKKEVMANPVVQNVHNGGINDLLWSENYTFVITAGRDKKIGVWRFN